MTYKKALSAARGPFPVTISRTERDPKKVQELYDRGHKEGEAALPGMLEFLAKNGWTPQGR